MIEVSRRTAEMASAGIITIGVVEMIYGIVASLAPFIMTGVPTIIVGIAMAYITVTKIPNDDREQ